MNATTTETPFARPRVPEGFTEGGQFCAYQRNEAGGTLRTPLTKEQLAERAQFLASNGYVSAVTAVAGKTRTVAGWWAQAMSVAEVGGGYAKMADNETLSHTGGNSFQGERRTHRRTYTSGDIELRMPAAAAVKRFSASTGRATFDIPVTANVDGQSVVQWVRATENPSGRWSVSALGVRSNSGTKIAEGVSAVLEARQPTMALREAGDLLERRRARVERYGAPLEPVNSGFIKGVAFDESTSTMAITTAGGRGLYGYTVSRDVYEAVARSSSPGAAYNSLVRNKAQRVGVSRCEDCGRFSSEAVSHICQGRHNGPSDRPVLSELHNEVARSLLSRFAPAAFAPTIEPDPAPAREVPGADQGALREKIQARRERRERAVKEQRLLDIATREGALRVRKFRDAEAEEVTAETLLKYLRAARNAQGTERAALFDQDPGAYINSASATVAADLANPGVRSGARVALAELSNWEQKFLIANGRQPSTEERDIEAERLRTLNPNLGSRPKRGFQHVVTTVSADRPLPGGSVSLSDFWATEDQYPSDTEVDPLNWNEIARRYGAPQPRPYVASQGQEIYRPKDIRSLLSKWRNETLSDEQHRMVFGPWGEPSFSEQEQIVRVLEQAESREASNKLWVAAEIVARGANR